MNLSVAGNSLNNLSSVYKDCDFTESYFSGFKKEYAGHGLEKSSFGFQRKKRKIFLSWNCS